MDKLVEEESIPAVQEKKKKKTLLPQVPTEAAASIEEDTLITSKYSDVKLTEGELEKSKDLFEDFSSFLKKGYDFTESKENKTTIPTGIDLLDTVLGGGVSTGLVQFVGPPGCGKAQPLYSKILTPSGWKTMGEMKIGNNVFDSRGEICNITNVSPQGEKDIYEIKFTDGTKARSTLDHLWICKKDYKSEFKVRRLEEIFEDINNQHTSDKKWTIPVNNAINFDKNNLPIDPYLLGCLLGDGSMYSRNDKISLTVSDKYKEIINICEKTLPDNIKLEVINGSKYGYIFNRMNRRGQGKKDILRNEMKVILNELGLLGKSSKDKFIPDSYKFSSIDDRLSILQGLCDTDGSIEKTNRMCFYSISKRLIDDVAFIIRSLGGRIKIYNKKTKYNGNIFKSFQLDINLPNCFPPVRVKEKSKLLSNIRKRTITKCIKSVKFVEKSEAQCIEVNNPNGSYITDEFIVTHNSTLAAKVISSGQRKWPGKFISVYLDSENTTTKKRLTDLGVKYPEINPQNGITIEKVFSIVEGLCAYKEEHKDILDVPSIIVWDSIASTPTEAEVTTNTEQLSIQASALTKYLKKYSDKMANYNICLFALNQLRDSMQVGKFKGFNKLKFLGAYNIPGGNANLFASTQLFFFRPTGDVAGEYGFNGVKLTGKAVKNKLFSPNIDISMIVSFERGFSNFWTNYELLKRTKRIKAAAWCTLESYPTQKFRQKEAIKYYRENAEFRKAWDNDVEDVLRTEIIEQYETSEEDADVWK